MELDNEMESNSSEDSSEEEVMEALEEKKNKKRRISLEEEGNVVDRPKGAERKKMRSLSEKEIKKLSKPATAEELNRLRETENLFHSNLFRLQIEEMLKEVQLKQKYRLEFEKWFKKFHSNLMKLENSDKKYNLGDIEWLKMLKIKVPLPKLPAIEKGGYQFKKPINIEIIGSYALETLVGPKVSVDVLIELPSNFYVKNDFLNCSYHMKRALYLCNLIGHIQNMHELIQDVNFICDETDVLKPKIELVPSGKLSKVVIVLLHVIAEKGRNDLKMLSPKSSNVNRQWFFEKNNSNEEFTSDNSTPFYNSTILSDLVFKENYKFMHNLLEPHKNIKDGIILFKIWLKQHELISGIGDFSGFLVLMLVAYLMQIRKLNSYMSSYQVLRTIFNYLVSSDWTHNGITLCRNTDDVSIPLISDFEENHKVVFIDTTGYYNLCYGMHPSKFQEIQQEAQIALNTLDNPFVNSFQILFMTPVPFYRHFDQIIIYHNEEALQNTAEIYSLEKERLNHCCTIYPQLLNLIYDVLKKGFHKRINCLNIRQSNKIRWKAHKKFHHSLGLCFGLNLNPENYFLVVEKAEESECEDFRNFWGELSELRRFQDGTITEAVVWNANSFSEKRLICKQIVSYLMKSKFRLDNKDFQYIANQFENFISANLEESAFNIIGTFNKLSKELRNLKDLPLPIVSVQGASPVFRYTEVFPNAGNNVFTSDKHIGMSNQIVQGRKSKNGKLDINMTSVPTYVNPVKVVLQMGATNKWPQDLGAINRLRTAFYLKIARCLTTQCDLKTKVYTDKIKVYKEGCIFHLKILCPNEIGLLKQVVEDGLIKYRDNELSIAVERQMIFLPKLSSAFHGLHEQHSSFGPACCLVKRWVNSQMIDVFHLSEEVLDMLVASLYLNPAPHEIPQQPQVAFLRFLHMIASKDWNSEYIVLNINNELGREDILEIESHFTTNRDKLPALFIATPYDKNSLWTINCPTPLILLRLIQLCANVLDYVEKRIYQNLILEKEFQILFEPHLDPYNVIIHLNSNFIARNKISNENFELQTANSEVQICDFDPVAVFLKELRETYDDFALFFYDIYGGSVIGVLWKPNIQDPVDFKVQNMAMRSYKKSTEKLHLTLELIIEDFLIIGKQVVKSIDLRENGNIKNFSYL